MSFFRTGYDTTLGVAIPTSPIERCIKEAIVRDGVDYNTLDVITSEQLLPLFVTGLSGSESNIPLFAHPLVVKNHNHHDYLCTDIRLFIKNQLPITAKNTTEFNFVKSRAILNLAWLTGSPSGMKNTLGFAATVFSAWISEVISKRFALDPRDQLVLAIISHFYFQSLHYPESTFDEETKQIFAVHTMKATKCPSQLVFEVFDKITQLRNIDDYCTNVKAILENVRLKDFNVGMLITCIGVSWFGTNAKEILAVALEHPPTWYAIVFTSLNERTYKDSMVARVAERYGKNNAWDSYSKSYGELVKGYLQRDNDNRPGLLSFSDFKD